MGPAQDTSRWELVCELSHLVSHTMIRARVLGVDIIVGWHDNKAFACERACPHEQADLSRGHCIRGRLYCPHHAASFDLVSGEISAGWPARPLRLYPLEIEAGQVFVDASQCAGQYSSLNNNS